MALDNILTKQQQYNKSSAAKGLALTQQLSNSLGKNFGGSVQQAFDASVLKGMISELNAVNEQLGDEAFTMEELLAEIRRISKTEEVDQDEIKSVLDNILYELETQGKNLTKIYGPSQSGVENETKGKNLTKIYGPSQSGVENETKGINDDRDGVKSTLDNILYELETQGKNLTKLYGPSVTSETENENIRAQEDRDKVQRQIRDELRNITKVLTKPDEEQRGNLEIPGTGLAIMLGSITGYVAATAKIFKDVVVSLAKMAKSLSIGLSRFTEWVATGFPRFKKILFQIEVWGVAISETFKSFTSSLKTGLGVAKENVLSVVEGFGKYFDDIIGYFKTIIGGMKESKFIKTFIDLFDDVLAQFKIIEDNSAGIRSLFEKIGGAIGKFKSYFDDVFKFFADMGTKFSWFGKILGATSKIVSKLVYPIIAIYEGITGFLDGMEKSDNVLGKIGHGIMGAITNIVDSVVVSIVELGKDIISWVAGALGFDEVEKFLDSFDISKTFKEGMELITLVLSDIPSFIKWIVESVGDFFKNIEIPGLTIDLPGLDPFTLGPWKPFGDYEPNEPPKKQVLESVQPETSPKIVILEKVNPNQADQVYKKSSENKASESMVVVTPSQTVVNAPTSVNKQTQNLLTRTNARTSDSSMQSFIRDSYI